MKRLLGFGLLCLALGGQPALSEVLDRILAIVNNTPILLSDWDEAWRCEALLSGRSPESYTEAEQQDVFRRLIDQELLRQQMRTYLLSPLTAEDVQKELKDVRTQLSGDDEAKWKSLLTSTGVTEAELTRRLRHEMEVQRFVDARFRATIRVDDRAVARYYREEFLPQVRRAGGKDIPIDEVAGKIRELLTQQRINEQLNGWEQALREQADIEIPPEVSIQSPAGEANRSK